jgi:hypothetical protein
MSGLKGLSNLINDACFCKVFLVRRLIFCLLCVLLLFVVVLGSFSSFGRVFVDVSRAKGKKKGIKNYYFFFFFFVVVECDESMVIPVLDSVVGDKSNADLELLLIRETSLFLFRSLLSPSFNLSLNRSYCASTL